MTFSPGDILAFHGTDLMSRVIRYWTATPFAPERLRIGPSHVGIIFERHGRMLLGESTSLCKTPCEVIGQKIAGVQAHNPEDRIWDYTGQGGWVDVYRLTEIDRLGVDDRKRLAELVETFVGLPYDKLGAALSGTRCFQALRLFPKADLHTLFCSEMVAAVLQRLCRMNRDNPTRFNPARLMRRLIREGTYQWEGRIT